MLRLGSAPLTEFLEIDFALHKLAILSRPVVDVVTLSATKLYKLIL